MRHALWLTWRHVSGLVLVVALVVAVGCCGHPIHVATCDHVQMDKTIVTDGRIITEHPPVSLGGPLVAMTVSGCPCGPGPKVAILDVDGLLVNTDLTGPYSLGENPLAIFREKLDAIEADRCVAAVVLRLNSPGGSVAATDMMWHDLQEVRERTHRPVVACLLDVATGGAYYLATASDAIVASPMTVTGGIGVILNLYNLRELMAQYNVFSQEIKAGPNIDIGTSIRNLSDENKALLQEMAN